MAESMLSGAALGYDAAAPIVQWTAVKLSDDHTVTPCTAEGDLWIGISMFSVSAAEITRGKGASVQHTGMPLVKVGSGGVTFGTLGVIDAAGLVVASNTGGRPLGVIMASGSAGDFVPVWLTSPGLPVV